MLQIIDDLAYYYRGLNLEISKIFLGPLLKVELEKEIYKKYGPGIHCKVGDTLEVTKFCLVTGDEVELVRVTEELFLQKSQGEIQSLSNFSPFRKRECELSYFKQNYHKYITFFEIEVKRKDF